jgi:hypothetical protein
MVEIVALLAELDRTREVLIVRKEISMVQDGSAQGSNISPYLQQPLRTLKQAEQDNNFARHHLEPAQPAPGKSLEPDPSSARELASSGLSSGTPAESKERP